jgi:hypothetical protein
MPGPELTGADVKGLIHPSIGANDEPEYETGVQYFEDGDDNGAELYEAAERAAAAPAVAEQEGPSEAELALQRRADELARQEAALKAQREAQNEEDFQKLLATKTPEEQLALVKEHYAERDRAREVEHLQLAMERDFPLATAIGAPFFAAFDLEIADPANYRRSLEVMEGSFEELINGLVEERVNERLAAANGQKARNWDLSGLGGATPKPPTTRIPTDTAQSRFEAQKQSLIEAKQVRPSDVQELLRRKALAQASRGR